MKKYEIEKPFCLWFTGLPSSGKTTLAIEIKKELEEDGLKIVHLDGDILRDGLNSDLGFSKEDREENNRRVIYLSKLLVENGIPVVVSFISPYESIREKAKDLIPNIIRCFIDCPVEECIERDVKGLYAKAKNGEIKGMTGVDDPFEVPSNIDIRIKTNEESKEGSCARVIDYLCDSKYLKIT